MADLSVVVVAVGVGVDVEARFPFHENFLFIQMENNAEYIVYGMLIEQKKY